MSMITCKSIHDDVHDVNSILVFHKQARTCCTS